MTTVAKAEVSASELPCNSPNKIGAIKILPLSIYTHTQAHTHPPTSEWDY